ncbi:MAG: MFS transporter [Lentimicrobiaceae bacterium]|nr:MFS transporter [Lentimicrobiaceae bacterium]
MPFKQQAIRGYLLRHKRWGIVVLLFFTAVVNNFDRLSLSILAPTLKKAMGFGSVEYSYIVTSFLVAYTIGYTFSGKILDQVGVRIGLAVALGFWSMISMFHALAWGWISLVVFRFLLGLGESFNSPAGVKAVAEWIPTRERGLSMAVFSNGNVVGALLAPPIIALLTLHFGWRWGFISTGVFGIILLIFWWRHYYSPESHPRLLPEERTIILGQRGSSGSASKGLSMWQLLQHPLCIGFITIRFLTDSITFFFAFWFPDYLQNARGFSLAMVGLIAWIPFLAADIGGPGGGALSDWLIRRGWPSFKARRTLMLVSACLSPLALVAVRTDSIWLSVGLIAVLLASQACWMSNQLTLISESINRENLATLLSLTAIGGSLGGIVTTLIAGRLIASVGYIPVFTGIGLLHMTAFIILILTVRKTGSVLTFHKTTSKANSDTTLSN